MAKGGTRYGAGRPAHHVKAERCRQIDARRWQREGMLRPGYSGGWYWRDAETGKQTASISMRCEAGAVVLSYAINGTPVTQHLPILRTPCNFGGDRPWFGCPACCQRVAVLFLHSSGFYCRKCASVAYSSQSDDPCGRAWDKQRKAEAKLGKYWSRPKGMHQTTHTRLVSIIWGCEDTRNRWIKREMTRLGLSL